MAIICHFPNERVHCEITDFSGRPYGTIRLLRRSQSRRTCERVFSCSPWSWKESKWVRHFTGSLAGWHVGVTLLSLVAASRFMVEGGWFAIPVPGSGSSNGVHLCTKNASSRIYHIDRSLNILIFSAFWLVFDLPQSRLPGSYKG